MLQVDENIGGRQDQKNQNLPTKMLAVGLLMLVGVGCFVVGFFSVTTTNTANTAHTRVSSPKVDGMVSNLQDYPVVHITNKTPHYSPRVFVRFDGSSCYPDFTPSGLDDGDTWTPNKREGCLVGKISAILNLSTGSLAPQYNEIECAPYFRSGTGYSIFFILMKGDHACCVLSSLPTSTLPKCP